jgi:hypothetical protein
MGQFPDHHDHDRNLFQYRRECLIAPPLASKHFDVVVRTALRIPVTTDHGRMVGATRDFFARVTAHIPV